VDLIGSIGLGDQKSRSKDVLGRVYEYFLGKCAAAEGKKSGQFYTPSCVVKTLVKMISPFRGRIYDPCCGSGGMFVQSERFIAEHGGKIGDISVYGQESNPTTRRLAAMNLAIRSIEADLGPKHEDTFRDTLHPDLKADFILANPPFGIKEWTRRIDDVRWKYGIPPSGSSDYAWIQHFIHHLTPNGFAGFVMSNGSMTSNQSGEGEIRKAILEADMVDCLVALPGQLFYSTPIPVCLWFIARNKSDGKRRNRKGETLFIDARKMGTMVDRVHRELTDEDINKIVSAYHSWRGEKGSSKYEDVTGFCKASNLESINKHGCVLTPGRYTGTEDVEEDSEGYEIKIPRLIAELDSQFQESSKLENAIKANLKKIGYGS
jgi:type I restriction enzyme M protein